MSERWKAVVEFEGFYEVSNLARVRSLDRHVRVRNRWGGESVRRYPGVEIIAGPHTGGYLMVSLYKNGQRHGITLHRAVCEAFIGPRPPGCEILHADDDK